LITLYSNNCVKCKIIKKQLEEKGIKYEIVEDMDAILAEAKEHGISSMPFAKINGEILELQALQKYISERGYDS
jgi:glutaredoxin